MEIIIICKKNCYKASCKKKVKENWKIVEQRQSFQIIFHGRQVFFSAILFLLHDFVFVFYLIQVCFTDKNFVKRVIRWYIFDLGNLWCKWILFGKFFFWKKCCWICSVIKEEFWMQVFKSAIGPFLRLW